MKQRLIGWLPVLAGLVCAGCQEPHNIRMRFAAALPGEPAQLVGINARHRLLLCDAQSQEVVRTLGDAGSTVRELRVSPDGAKVATVGENGYCRVWNTSGGLAMTVRGGGEDRGAVAFSHDGRHLACGATGYIDVYSLDKQTRVRRIPDPGKPDLYLESTFAKMDDEWSESRILSLDFKPTGHRILVSTDLGVFEIDYLRCSVVWQLSGRSGMSAKLVRYAPDGEHFIIQPASGPLEYYHKRKPIASFDPKSEQSSRSTYASAEFSRDGSYLALTTADGTFSIVRLADQKTLMLASPGKLDAHGIALGANGRYAWVGSQGNVERFTRFTLPDEMIAKLPNFN